MTAVLRLVTIEDASRAKRGAEGGPETTASGDLVDPDGNVADADDQAAPETEDDGRYIADYEVDVKGATWKHSGVRLKITDLRLADRAAFCEPFGPYEDSFDAPEVCDTEFYPGDTIVALDMGVRNRSGQDIDWYPDQATLVLGDEQVEGELLGPETFPATFRADTKHEAQAWWLSKQNVDDVYDLGEMRIVTASPDYTESYELVTGSYDEIDLAVEWPTG